MVIWGMATFSAAWALWLTYMLRYRDRWDALIDRNHQVLRKYGLSWRWMQAAEKGAALKLIVGATVLLSLACVVVLMKHPMALHDFFHEHTHP